MKIRVRESRSPGSVKGEAAMSSSTRTGETGNASVKNTIRTDALRELAGDSRVVARAMALLWTWGPRSASFELLRHLGAKSAAGRAFTIQSVKLAQEDLTRAGLLIEQDMRPGYSRLTDEARAAVSRAAHCHAHRGVA
jgi:hypothetical protein